jgi:diacylglycerol kinase (ATP)
MNELVAAAANSLRGLSLGIRSERALRQEVAALIAAIVVAPFVAPSGAWFVAMIGAILLVMSFELLNTAIEKLADHVTPHNHPAIGAIKDISSAAVFCALMFAGLIWFTAIAFRFGIL